MTRRLAAAALGAALVLGVFLAYSLDERPVEAGSNRVAPFYAALPLPSGTQRCQSLTHVPAKASRVRLIGAVEPAEASAIRVSVLDPSGVNTKGTKKDLHSGALGIRLKRTTRYAARGRICFANLGTGRIVLAGEDKRVRGSPVTGRRRGVPSVVFFRSHLSTWASRRDVIAERFANAQPGAFGGWSLWLAVLLAAAAVGLALWWLILRLEPQSG
jgi:hypothetical protein